MIGMYQFALLGVLLHLYLIAILFMKKPYKYNLAVLIISVCFSLYSALDYHVIITAYLGWFFIYFLLIGTTMHLLKYTIGKVHFKS